jgi:hypothetical protein
MRRSVAAFVAVIAVVAVLSLAGCGGGSPTPAASTGTPTSSGNTPPPSSSGAASSTAAPTLAAKPITEPRPFPTVTTPDQIPPEIAEALKAKRAFLLAFIDSRQGTTKDEGVVLAGLNKKFRGMLDFFTYDLVTYSKVSKDSDIYKRTQAAVLLGQKLNLGYMPSFVIVTKDGTIVWQSTGYYDEGTLEREILRATQ